MSERWKPEVGEQYWIVAFNETVQSEWRSDNADFNRWRMGNCFKTKEKAVTALEKFTALLLSLHEPTTEGSQLVTNCNQLPDWCKVGEWVWLDGNYHKVIEVGEDWIRTGWNNNTGIWGANILYQFSQARLRPYNADEIPDLPFEVSERNSNFRTTIVSCQGDKVWLAGATTAISTESLKCDFTTKGNPCGKLEHLENGEWVE